MNTKIEEIRTKELEKLTLAVRTLFKPRSTGRPLVFQCKDALEAGIITRYEAREILKHNNQPYQFPCFANLQ